MCVHFFTKTGTFRSGRVRCRCGVANTVLGEDPATFIILASHQPKPYDTRREKRLRKGSCRCCRAKSTRYEDTKTKMLLAFRSMECEMR